MARFRNFSIWRGRLPHWRADGETYYLTFRHRRDLDESERTILFRRLVKLGGRLDLLLLVILPGQSEAVFQMPEGAGEEKDFSDFFEKAKRQAGSEIIKSSGERFPPFYTESFDRIIRDDAELDETLDRMMGSPEHAGLCSADEEYQWLWADEALLAAARIDSDQGQSSGPGS